MGFYGSKYRDVIYDVPITEARMINDIELELMNEAVTLDILDEEAKFNFLPKFKDRKELRGVYKDLKDAQDTLNYAGEYDAAYGKKAGSLALRILDKVAAIGSFAAAGAGLAVVGTSSLAVGLVIAIPVYLLTRVVQWAVKNKKEDEAKGMVEEAIGKLENLKSSGDEDDAAKIDALINKLKDKLHKLETSKKEIKKEEKVEKKIEKAAKKEEKQAIKDAKKLMKAEKKANVKKPEEIDDDPDEDLVEESAIEESNYMIEQEIFEEMLLQEASDGPSKGKKKKVVKQIEEEIKEVCRMNSVKANISQGTSKFFIEGKTDKFTIAIMYGKRYEEFFTPQLKNSIKKAVEGINSKDFKITVTKVADKAVEVKLTPVEKAIKESGECDNGVCPEHILDAIDKFASDDQVDTEQIKEECDLDSCAENIEDETEKLKKTDEFEIEDEEHPLKEQEEYASMLEFMVSNGISLNDAQLEALKEEYLVEAKTPDQKERKEILKKVKDAVNNVMKQNNLSLRASGKSKAFVKGTGNSDIVTINLVSGSAIAVGVLFDPYAGMAGAANAKARFSEISKDPTFTDQLNDAFKNISPKYNITVVSISLGAVRVKIEEKKSE